MSNSFSRIAIPTAIAAAMALSFGAALAHPNRGRVAIRRRKLSQANPRGQQPINRKLGPIPCLCKAWSTVA